jgi:hypothetical protein
MAAFLAGLLLDLGVFRLLRLPGNGIWNFARALLRFKAVVLDTVSWVRS